MPIDWSTFKKVDPKYLSHPDPPPPSQPSVVITKYGPMVIRGAGGLLAGEGGPTGAFISGASELAAQKLAGERNPASVAGAAAIGAIPFGSSANIARAALKGAALSGGATALNQQTEQGLHLPSREEAKQVAIASGVGGATGGALHGLFGGKAVPPKSEPKLLTAGEPQLRLRERNPFQQGPAPEVKLIGSGQTEAAKAAAPKVEVKPKAKATPKAKAIVKEPTVPVEQAGPIVKTPKQLKDEQMLRENLARIQGEAKEPIQPKPGETVIQFQKRTSLPFSEAKKIHEQFNAKPVVEQPKVPAAKAKPVKKSIITGKPIVEPQPQPVKPLAVAPVDTRPIDTTPILSPEARAQLEADKVKLAQPLVNIKLPKELAGAKPRYRTRQLQFEDDIDKALYIVASPGSARHEDYVQFLLDSGVGINKGSVKFLADSFKRRIGKLAENTKLTGEDKLSIPRMNEFREPVKIPRESIGPVKKSAPSTANDRMASSEGLAEETVPITQHTTSDPANIKPCKDGECFKNAAMFVRENNHFDLVHGQVTNDKGKTLDHAWAESGSEVVDPTTGVRMPKEQWYELVDAKPAGKYNNEEATINMIKEGHFGPWGDEAKFHSSQPTVEIPNERSTADDYSGPTVTEPSNAGGTTNQAQVPPTVKINVDKARSYQAPRPPKPSAVGMKVEDLGNPRVGGGTIPPVKPPNTNTWFGKAASKLPRDKKTGKIDWSEIINAPKAFRASGDLSAALRQGIVLARRPAWRDSIKPMLHAANPLNEGAYRAELAKLEAHPRYKMAQEDGVRFSAVDQAGKAGEEQFGSRLARKTPFGIGKYLIAPSERAYTTFLNSLRIKTYDEMMTAAEHLQSKDPKAFGEIPRKNIANYINTASGRGSLAPTITSASRTGEKAAEVLNLGLFSPRFIASRMQLLNPATYYKLDPFTRKEALKDMGSMLGMVGSGLALAKAAGAEVTADPTSPDFGKVKLGNTRIDLTGGFGPYMRFFAQAVKGVATGEKGPDVARFAQSKESPTVGIASEMITGKDFFGREQNRAKPLLNTIKPMIADDLYDIWKSDPNLLIPAGAAAVLGLPVQSYDDSGNKGSGSGSSSARSSSAKSSRTRYKP